MSHLLRVASLGVGLFCVSAGSAFAQSTFGTITGRVTDESGAVLPGVSVDVTHQAMNVTRTALTDERGNYSVTHLNAGVYRVAAELQGFSTAVFPDIRLDSATTIRIDAQLTVGAVAEEVVVTAAAPVVDAEVPMLSDVKDHRTLTDLPMNIRGGAASYQWTWLVPTGTQGTGSSRSFGGARTTMNNFNVDGISTASPAFGNELERVQPSRESIQEVRFEYANSRAEFGAVSNATAISRSGGNQLRGSAFWSYYPNELKAKRDFFAPSGAVDVPNQRDDMFGGSLGGPIKRDRAFFFASYEGNRLRRVSNLNPTLPTMLMRQGNFSQLLNLPTPIAIRDPLTQQAFPGNVIPANRLNHGSLAWQERFYRLEPNFGGPNELSNNWRGTFPISDRLYQIDGRIDYQFSPGNTLYGRFSYTDAPRTTTSALPPEVSGSGHNIQKGNSGSVVNTWVASPSLVNEARFGFAFRSITSSAGCCQLVADAQEAIDMVGIQGLMPAHGVQGLPGITISGFSGVATGQDGYQEEWSYQASNQISYTRGRHLWKTGIEYRYGGATSQVNPHLGGFSFTNFFTGHAYADFLLGYPRTTNRTLPRQDAGRRFSALSLFVQDDYRVTPNLSLYYGVRWQVDQPAFEKNNMAANFDAHTGRLIVPDAAALAAIHPLFPAAHLGGYIPVITEAEFGRPWHRDRDLNNLAPRVGFAYRPFGHSRTAVRGGYGLFYDNFTLGVSGNLFAASPFGLAESFTSNRVNGVPQYTLQQPFGAVGAVGAIQLSGVSHDLENPKLHQWNLTLEQEIPFRMSLRLSYLGTKGAGLVWQRNVNQPVPSIEPFSASRRPFPAYNNMLVRQNGGSSLYNGMTVEVRRRMHGGLQFQSAWTWAKHLTDATDTGGESGGTVENSHNVRAQKGNATFTPRHRVVSTLIWELPVGAGRRFLDRDGLVNYLLGGWSLSAIHLAQTGLWMTPSFGGADPSNTNTIGGRPDRICDGNLPRSQRTIDRWFDASCFAVPPANAGRFGTAGVNILEGPGRWNANLGLFKSFPFTGGSVLRLEVTATNVFNHTNFSNPNTNISNVNVGRISSTFGGGRAATDFAGLREVMVGVRYQF